MRNVDTIFRLERVNDEPTGPTIQDFYKAMKRFQR